MKSVAVYQAGRRSGRGSLCCRGRRNAFTLNSRRNR